MYVYLIQSVRSPEKSFFVPTEEEATSIINEWNREWQEWQKESNTYQQEMIKYKESCREHRRSFLTFLQKTFWRYLIITHPQASNNNDFEFYMWINGIDSPDRESKDKIQQLQEEWNNHPQNPSCACKETRQIIEAWHEYNPSPKAPTPPSMSPPNPSKEWRVVRVRQYSGEADA